MNWFAPDSCGAIATYSWVVGAVAGLLVDAVLLLAIAQTPPLRDHGGAPPPPGFVEQRVLPHFPIVVTALWFAGLYVAGAETLPCYAIHSATAAAILVGLIILFLIPLAATHVARRSVW